jgi:hypothetical protein
MSGELGSSLTGAGLQFLIYFGFFILNRNCWSMSIVKLDLYFLCLSFCLYSLQPLPHIIQNVHKCVRKNHQIKQIHTDSIHYLPCFKLAKWNMLPRNKSTSVLLYSVTSTWSPLTMLNYYYPSLVSGKLTHLVVIITICAS